MGGAELIALIVVTILSYLGEAMVWVARLGGWGG
jgi:hypothetical protein